MQAADALSMCWKGVALNHEEMSEDELNKFVSDSSTQSSVSYQNGIISNKIISRIKNTVMLNADGDVLECSMSSLKNFAICKGL